MVRVYQLIGTGHVTICLCSESIWTCYALRFMLRVGTFQKECITLTVEAVGFILGLTCEATKHQATKSSGS